MFQTALKRRGSREAFKDKKPTSQVNRNLFPLILITLQNQKVYILQLKLKVDYLIGGTKEEETQTALVFLKHLKFD